MAPNNIKIAGRTYSVHGVPAIHLAGDHGRALHHTLCFEIAEDIPTSHVFETIVGLILATINHITYAEKPALNSRLVANMWFQVLKDNPLLLQELIALNEVHII